jgi:hypothetical protein
MPCCKESTYTNGDERDGLVDSPQRRDIDSLSSNSSLGTNSGRVLSGSSVDDSINCKVSKHSHAHVSIIHVPKTWMGFCSVTRWMISKAC